MSSSSSSISILTYASQQIVIYVAIPIFIIGIIGNILNIIIFLSLKTFRENSCVFYLTILSISNIGLLLTGTFTRIMTTGFRIESTTLSVFYCKFNWYFTQVCGLISFTCMCLATIDQFLATCAKPSWQQWSNIKIAHRLTAGFTLLWFVLAIPYWIYFDIIILPTTKQQICTSTNNIFGQFYIYLCYIIFSCIIPLSITIVFGFLSYRNVQQISHRTVPLVRREVEKQLSIMVFVHIIYNVIATVPFTIVTLFTSIPALQNLLTMDQLNFITALVACLYFLNFSTSFYMYCCISERFRRQFFHVTSRIYLRILGRHRTNVQ